MAGELTKIYFLSITKFIFIYIFLTSTRDGNMENAKILAEFVDNKLSRHYELDDSGAKKVRFLPRGEMLTKQTSSGV